MINVEHITALISALSVETEKESNSPEPLVRRTKGRQTVGFTLHGIGETNDAVNTVDKNDNRDWHLTTPVDTR